MIDFIRIFFLTLLFMVIISFNTHAQPANWESHGVGGGGALFQPEINPNNDNEIFLTCDMSEIFHSTDFGESWNIIDYRKLVASGLYGQMQFTSSPSIFYTINYAGEVAVPSKSTDGGTTWTSLSNDPTQGGAFSLCADPNSTNNIALTDYYNLFFSSDGGNSFTKKYTTASGNGCHIAGVFFDGANIYIGTNQGLLVSANGGSTFSVSSITGIPATEAMVSFAGAKQNGTVRLYCVTLGSGDVYAGITGADHNGYKNVYVLDIGQPSWTQKINGIPAGAHPFYVSMAKNNIGVAYLAGGSTNSTPTIFKTIDGGTSWQNVFFTSNNQNIFTGWSGDGGDRLWSYGEYALGFIVSPNDPNKALITDLGFAHLTTNGGASWKQAYDISSYQNPMNAPTPKGKSYKGNGLENTSCWGVAWADSTNIIGCFTDIKGTISTDAGTTWSFNYTGHNLNTMYHAVKHPTTGVMYAATSSVHDMYQSTYLTDARIDGGAGQVLFSNDKGKTWQTLHDFQHPVVWLAPDPNNANRLYASVIHSSLGGIYVSSNIQNGSGSTWTKLAAPPRTQGHPYNIFVLNDGTLLCTYSGRRLNNAFTNSSGVFVSTNAGTSWIDRSDPGMLYWTKDAVIYPYDASQNTWYTCVFSGWGGAPNGLGGLYRTTNRGVSWTKINSLDRIESCTFHPANSNIAYLTTEVNGLWYSNNITSSSPAITSVASYPFQHPMRVYFNQYKQHEIWVTSVGNGIRIGNDEQVPVELSSFSYSMHGNDVQLHWRTETEQNNFGFEIERNGTGNGQSEGLLSETANGSWSNIGFVKGTGTSSDAHEYSFTDKNAHENIKYQYRLKQIDLNGEFTYSKAIEVDLSVAMNSDLNTVYPNPVRSVGTVTFSVSSDRNGIPVSITLYDLLGREVKTIVHDQFQSGKYQVNIDTQSIQDGMYILEMKTPKKTFIRRMMVLR